VFCEVGQHFLPRLPKLCQNGGLSVLSSIGETEKIGWMGDESHVFGKKLHGEKQSARRCVVLMQQPVLCL
jgi:hypothetical protein